MADLSKMTQSIERISELAKGLKKGDPFVKELQDKLKEFETMLLKGLEEDERIKAQKKAS